MNQNLNALGEELLEVLDPLYRSRLLSMYRGEDQFGTDGQLHPIDNATKIYPSQGIWLYTLCLSVKPKTTLEIGMAYGYSTLYFLAAAAKNPLSHHTAIDPYQCSYYKGIGVAHANALTSTLAPNSAFRFIENRSDIAASDLVRSNSTFDIIFIDGNHRFDDVLVDFYLYVPLCAIGGYMIFDDMWMSSIQTVVAYIRANRTDFIEVQTDQPNVCAFQKVGDDTRNWNHFREFSVFGNSD